MKYVLLIYAPQDVEPDPDMMAKHRAFAENVGRRGLLVSGAALSEADLATSVRFNGNEMLLTDGPYVETKEHLGGFYIIECPDLDAAIDVAQTLPVVTGGGVEIRPLIER